MNGRHYLIVGPFNPDDPAEAFDIEHPDDCPVEEMPAGDGMPYLVYACDVGYHLEAMGFDGCFVHVDDPGASGPHRQQVAEGRHVLEAWSRRYPSTPFRSEEFDGGLQVIGGPLTETTS